MKKIGQGLLCMLLLMGTTACIRQTVHHGTRYLDHHSFHEVWRASIRAVNEIGFTVYSLDKSAGFIGAESGTHIGQEVPPRLAIMISDVRGRIFVECRILQKEFVDIFGHGRRTVRNFMTALNLNLNS